jgi:hypothetical protein
VIRITNPKITPLDKARALILAPNGAGFTPLR